MANRPNNPRGRGQQRQRQLQNWIDLRIGRIEKNQTGTDFEVPVIVEAFTNGQPQANRPFYILDDTFRVVDRLQTEANGQKVVRIKVSLDRAGEDVSFTAHTKEAPYLKSKPDKKKLPALKKEKEATLKLKRLSIVEDTETSITYSLEAMKDDECVDDEDVFMFDRDDRIVFAGKHKVFDGLFETNFKIPSCYLGQELAMSFACCQKEATDKVAIPSPRFQGLKSESKLENDQVRTKIEGRLLNSNGSPRENNPVSVSTITGNVLAGPITATANGYFCFNLDFTEEEVKKGLQLFIMMVEAPQVNATVKVAEPKTEPELSFRFIETELEAKADSEVKVGFLLTGKKKPEDEAVISKAEYKVDDRKTTVETKQVGNNIVVKLPLTEKDLKVAVTAHPFSDPTLIQTATITVKAVQVLRIFASRDITKVYGGQEIQFLLKSDYLKDMVPSFSIQSHDFSNGTERWEKGVYIYKAPEVIPRDLNVVIICQDTRSGYGTSVVLNLRAVKMTLDKNALQPIPAGSKNVMLPFNSCCEANGFSHYKLELLDFGATVTEEGNTLDIDEDFFQTIQIKVRAISLRDNNKVVLARITISPARCDTCGGEYTAEGYCLNCFNGQSFGDHIDSLPSSECRHCHEKFKGDWNVCPYCGKQI